ncbi:MAG: hypothetical protein ABUL52_00925 [Solimonas sp.]
MKKIIAVGVIGLLIGGAIGTNGSRYFAHQHERTTAVMVLLQLHQKEWERAVQNRNCAEAAVQMQSLQYLANEISVVLPLADQQDAVFHRHVQKMKEVLSLPEMMQCSAAVNVMKQVRDACDECHRDYR